MRKIEANEIDQIARGSAVIAAGGGGDPFRGKLAATAVLNEHGPVQLVTLDELNEDALIASVFLIGAPIALLEKFPFRDELVRALRELERHNGRPVEAIFAVEAGGLNSILPLSVAAIIGLPIIDADTMGRAYPAMDLTLVNLAGMTSSPVVLTDDHGTVVTVETDDNDRLETIARSFSHQSGAVVAAAGFARTVKELREGLALGTISLAMRIGQTMATTTLEPRETWDEILEYTGGRHLFEGKVNSVNQDVEDGWGVGTVLIEGTGAYAGSEMRIDVINENLVAAVDDAVVATVPDIISVYDATSGAPLSSENVRFGYRVGVVALPCDERWVTSAGIRLGGPRRFGFDFDYRDFRLTDIDSPNRGDTAPTMRSRAQRS